MRTDFLNIRQLDPLMAIGAGLSLVNAVGKWIGGNKQSKEAKKINPVWQQYQTNPFAKRQLALAQNLFSGRMAGASNMERNLMASQGNTINNISRLGTDSSQALALNALSQDQTDQSLSNLQIQEAGNQQAMLGNLNNAYSNMVNEGDKEYESILQKFQMDVSRKDALAKAGAENKYGAVGDLASMAFSMAGQDVFGGGEKRQLNRGVNNFPVSQRMGAQAMRPNMSPTINSSRFAPMQMTMQPNFMDRRGIGQPPNWRFPG